MALTRDKLTYFAAALLWLLMIGLAHAQPLPTERDAPAALDAAPGDAPSATPDAKPAPSSNDSALADDPVAQASGGFAAIKGGHILVAVGFGLLLLGSAVRYGLSLKWAFWTTPIGGYVVAGSMGGVALGLGLASGAGFSLDLVGASVAAALAAMAMHGPASRALPGPMKTAKERHG